MATQGTVGRNESVGTAEEKIMDAADGDTPCTTFMVRNNGSTDLVVRIPALHKGVAVGAGVNVAPGEREYFRAGESNGITQVFATAITGANVVDWGPVSAIHPV